MLYVLFSKVRDIKGVSRTPNAIFDGDMEKDWFNDPIVRQMIWDIDKTKVVKDYLMESEVLGATPSSMVVRWCKNFNSLHKQNYVTNIRKIGNNCLPWLFRLFREKDVYCSCSVVDVYFDETDIMVTCLNNGRRINTDREWFEMFCKFTEKYKVSEQEDDIERSILDAKRGIYRYN